MTSAQDRGDGASQCCETATGVRRVLELGVALPELPALSSELDVNPHLLNTPDATLDLSTDRTHQ